MKTHLIQRILDKNNSLAIQNYCAPFFLKIWHYHPELELNVIHESVGTALVGDHIERFKPGDIVLIGKNLPHLWLNDADYFRKDSNLITKSHIIHFLEDFAGRLFDIPEMEDIRNLLQRSQLGIKFIGKSNSEIINKIDTVVSSSGFNRIMAFIEVLKILSEQKHYKTLSSPGYLNTFINFKKDRLLPVYEYIMSNFKQEVCLEKAASLAHMNSSSFSRYFKQIHKKNFIQYLNETRIGYACRLLREKKQVATACYESGFNNISNFNRQFKKMKGMNPSEYINSFKGE